MFTWLRVRLCSFVKPWPAISLSQKGLGERFVSWDFSSRAGRCIATFMKLSNCSLWHWPQASQDVSVSGRVSGPGFARCFARPRWQFTQLFLLCLPMVWSCLIGS